MPSLTKFKQARYIPIPTLRFIWDANPPGDNVINYNLYYGTTPGTYTGHVNVGLILSYSLFAPTYSHFALTAVDGSSNESGFAAEIHR